MTVEQDTPSKVPILQPGDITTNVMCTYENACWGYFENKDIDDKQVRKILSALCDNYIQDWISINREHFLTMSFVEFMKEFCMGYLPEDWEDNTYRSVGNDTGRQFVLGFFCECTGQEFIAEEHQVTPHERTTLSLY